jgi:hypothetical protein
MKGSGIVIMPLIIIFFLAFISSNLYAQAEWVYTGDGARAAGMGETFTAVSDDSTAVFWNPAGLGQVKNLEISYNVIVDKWFEFDNTTFCLPLLIPSLGNFGTIAYAESNYTTVHFIPPEFVLYFMQEPPSNTLKKILIILFNLHFRRISGFS